jgi:hypothetical protein
MHSPTHQPHSLTALLLICLSHRRSSGSRRRLLPLQTTFQSPPLPSPPLPPPPNTHPPLLLSGVHRVHGSACCCPDGRRRLPGELRRLLRLQRAVPRPAAAAHRGGTQEALPHGGGAGGCGVCGVCGVCVGGVGCGVWGVWGVGVCGVRSEWAGVWPGCFGARRPILKDRSMPSELL